MTNSVECPCESYYEIYNVVINKKITVNYMIFSFNSGIYKNLLSTHHNIINNVCMCILYTKIIYAILF